MLYSEIKERENRFITALKIVFPFLLLLGIFFHSFQLFSHTSINFILLIFLIPIYVYYTVYLIYHGFQTTLIDSTTKTFIRSEMMTKIEKIKNRKNTTVIFINLDNLGDISERYGISNAELVLGQFIQKLEIFLKNHHFKQTPIGRYSSNSFLLFIEHPEKELKHLLTIFTKSLQNVGILGMEVRVSFSLLSADYDLDAKNIVERLLVLVEDQKKSDETPLNIKPDQFKIMIDKAIHEHKFLFKYQPSLELQSNRVTLLEILTRIDSKEYGILTKQQIQRMVNYAGYENEFDQKAFEFLLDEIQPLLEANFMFSMEVSPVTLRNHHFKNYLINLFKERKIDPHRFILEISEKNCYENTQRFKEIIQSYQEVGFKIALGNFGGNNCGFEYLKHLPIDMVKFDIEFTKKIDDLKYQQLLLHYVELTQMLHVQSMVKFVDKEAHFKKMREFKPDFIQGFCISKPKKIGELNEIR